MRFFLVYQENMYVILSKMSSLSRSFNNLATGFVQAVIVGTFVSRFH